MDLLTLLIVVLLIAWLLGGVIMPVGTNLIHALLVVIAIVILIKVLRREPL